MNLISLVLVSGLWMSFGEALNAYTWCTGAFLRDTIKKCSTEHKANKTDIEDFVYIRPAASENSKCFRACIFKECLLFNKRGNFLENVPQTIGYLASRRNLFHREIAEIAAKHCVRTIPAGTNMCDSTELFYKCIADKSPIRLSFEEAF